MAPKNAIDFDNINYTKKNENPWTKYTRSKAGNVLQAKEMSRRLKENGIISLVSSIKLFRKFYLLNFV